jgi:hypothetical protein
MKYSNSLMNRLIHSNKHTNIHNKNILARQWERDCIVSLCLSQLHFLCFLAPLLRAVLLLNWEKRRPDQQPHWKAEREFSQVERACSCCSRNSLHRTTRMAGSKSNTCGSVKPRTQNSANHKSTLQNHQPKYLVHRFIENQLS